MTGIIACTICALYGYWLGRETNPRKRTYATCFVLGVATGYIAINLWFALA